MYPSKILLFGEYTILLNSDALAVPFNRFTGELVFMDEASDIVSSEQQRSNLILRNFLSFIKEITLEKKLITTFDNLSFEKDIVKGLYFKSDIPEGSGLGSSGALVAAIFHKYTNISLTKTDVHKIKNDLAILESFFHGKSSGIDPLVSYMKSPMLLREKEIRQIPTEKIERTLREYGLFLVFSHHLSVTGELVEKFRTRCKADIEYLNKINLNYIPLNNKCISSVSSGPDAEIFFPIIRELTLLQSELFKEMIPENFDILVNKGLEQDLFYLKLCGSGGGGFFLGFTGNIPETESYFNKMGHNVLIY